MFVRFVRVGSCRSFFSTVYNSCFSFICEQVSDKETKARMLQTCISTVYKFKTILLIRLIDSLLPSLFKCCVDEHSFRAFCISK